MSDDTPADPTDPPAEYTEFVDFECYFRSFSSGNKDGDLILTLGVPQDEKYKAFPITDLQGLMVTVKVLKKKRKRRVRSDG